MIDLNHKKGERIYEMSKVWKEDKRQGDSKTSGK